jgi:hypothetical protein
MKKAIGVGLILGAAAFAWMAASPGVSGAGGS